PRVRSVANALGHKDGACRREGEGLAPKVILYVGAEVFRIVGIPAHMDDELVEMMDVFVYVGIWLGHSPYPAELYIAVCPRHLGAAHKGHRGALAVGDPGPCLPERL